MSAPKLCKDCKHYVENELGSGHDRCNSHPLETAHRGYPLVRGEQKLSLRYCDMQRNADWLEAIVFNVCGYKGRWWEAK